ncbi:Putative transcriptional regulator DJ-1 [Plasmopara halstedii]|uniref:Putative transcriptional regulator DJ-1 n=1 Tax=Plasmopara halstedii TaxID=4781 RepID=A0A0N7L375_PLAHL|nr:Putative transcriptional regulator DJ-1 [Plasmopara halstedii]CEG35091.1 Putative transcriptional regulator DJ-1 [Plasmopara halstedii]|eukprot:XP_024571460.1 Putative transcriptional regulator DJ-1 [Plasmopara halstedii]
MTTALIPIADGTEEIEAITLADVLTRGGVQVTLATVGKNPNNIVIMSRGIKLQGDVTIEACVGKSFDLIVIPGGMPGAEHLRDSKELVTLLKQQKENGNLYGAICAAPAVVLHSHGLLASGPATSYPTFESKMTGVDYKHENVVVNGKCVTSRGPGTAMAMGIKLVELLCGFEKAQLVAQGLLDTSF